MALSTDLHKRVPPETDASTVAAAHDLRIGKKHPFVDSGRHRLKGFDSAVQLYEVQWQEGAVG
jgi:class 3 adenylate cyclase